MRMISADAPEKVYALAGNLAEGALLILGDIDLPLSKEKRKINLIDPRFLPSAIFLHQDGHWAEDSAKLRV